MNPLPGAGRFTEPEPDPGDVGQPDQARPAQGSPRDSPRRFRGRGGRSSPDARSAARGPQARPEGVRPGQGQGHEQGPVRGQAGAHRQAEARDTGRQQGDHSGSGGQGVGPHLEGQHPVLERNPPSQSDVGDAEQVGTSPRERVLIDEDPLFFISGRAISCGPCCSSRSASTCGVPRCQSVHRFAPPPSAIRAAACGSSRGAPHLARLLRWPT